MQKQTTHTITAGEAAGTDSIVIELGFVPNKIVVRNRTSDYSLEWNDSMAADEYYQFTDGGVQTFEDTGTDTVTVIDGSDKTNNITTSFGVILTGNIANLTNAQEVLDICAIRDDQV